LLDEAGGSELLLAGGPEMANGGLLFPESPNTVDMRNKHQFEERVQARERRRSQTTM
jgi:hypothetical protein